MGTGNTCCGDKSKKESELKAEYDDVHWQAANVI